MPALDYLLKPNSSPESLAMQPDISATTVSSLSSASVASVSSSSRFAWFSPSTKVGVDLKRSSGEFEEAPLNKSTASLIHWLWKTMTWSMGADLESAADLEANSATVDAAPSSQTRAWPAKCLEYGRMFAAALARNTRNHNQSQPFQHQQQQQQQQMSTHLGSFVEFEHLVRHELSSATAAAANQTQSQVSLSSLSSANMPSSNELLECYNQLQVNEYYQAYDILVGLRIASSLSILFVVFILFVIYKTGCRDGERTSRSQLRLTSTGSSSTKVVAAAKTNSRRHNCNQQFKQQQRAARLPTCSPSLSPSQLASATIKSQPRAPTGPGEKSCNSGQGSSEATTKSLSRPDVRDGEPLLASGSRSQRQCGHQPP